MWVKLHYNNAFCVHIGLVVMLIISLIDVLTVLLIDWCFSACQHKIGQFVPIYQERLLAQAFEDINNIRNLVVDSYKILEYVLFYVVLNCQSECECESDGSLTDVPHRLNTALGLTTRSKQRN